LNSQNLPWMTDWPQVLLALRAELDRLLLRGRELRVVNCVLAATLGQGRLRARLTARDIREWTGLASKDLGAVLGELVRMGLLIGSTGPEGQSWRIQTDPDFWRARRALDDAERIAWESRVARANGWEQLSLVAEPPALDELLADAGLARLRARMRSGAAPQGEQPTPPDFREPTDFRAGSPEKRADPVLTRARDVLDVQRFGDKTSTSKRLRGSARLEFLAETQPEIGRLCRRLQEFIGPADWANYWARGHWDYVFEEAAHRERLESSLRQCRAAIADGVTPKKSRGAMVWRYYQVAT
jgi:hypothetical protein